MELAEDSPYVRLQTRLRNRLLSNDNGNTRAGDLMTLRIMDQASYLCVDYKTKFRVLGFLGRSCEQHQVD